MEDRFAGVRLLTRSDGGEYVALGDGSVVHLHEYERLYAVPGLYEHIVQDRLGCRSPQVAAEGFGRAVSSLGIDPAGLTVLDVGAGTGLVGSLLRDAGLGGGVVGVDPLAAAREACLRDRPGVYRDYLVGDVGDLSERLQGYGLGGMVSAGAFGGTHGPPAVLTDALALLPAGAPVAFTIDERWMVDGSAFGVAVEGLVGGGRVTLLDRSRFLHRVTTAGDPVYYDLVVAVAVAGAG